MSDSDSGDTYRPSEHNRNQPSGGGNRNHRRGGGNRNRNRSRNRENRGGGNPSNRRPRQNRPPQKKSFFQKILGFFGLGGKKSAPSSKRPASKKSRPPRERKPVEVTSGRLFVGNLKYDVDDAALAEHFKTAGEVKSAEVVTNPHSGKSKGFAFVEMADIDQAKKAAELLHDKDFQGRRLAISGAKSQGKKSGDRGPSRDRGERRPRNDRDRGGRNDRGGRGGRNERGGRGRRGENRKPKRDGVDFQAFKPVDVEQVTSPTLALANLDENFSGDDLADLFEGVGTVSENKIEGNRATIQMASVDEAQKAVELLHAKMFMGKKLSVTGAAEARESAEA